MSSSVSAAQSNASAALASAKYQMGMQKVASATKAASALSDAELKRIDAAAQDFEAVFVTEMLKPMFNMINVDPQFGGGKGEEVFRDFMVNEYGKKIVSTGGIGIAAHVKDQLIRLQELSAERQKTGS